jgi:DNA-binding winged helix-turn-helix (wHTH) protein
MIYRFGDYELDTQLFELRAAGTPLQLEPKVFDLLAHLIRHHDRVVTKQELFARLWPEQFTNDAVLGYCIMAARKAVGDSGRGQRVIKTLHGRGYRFIAPVAVAELLAVRHQTAGTSHLPQRATFIHSELFVGREDELAQLHQWFTMALQGQRQVGFITGAAGIGKTALVDAFVAQVSATQALWVGHGQCIEQYGPGEPYLPVLEALGHLCRGAGGARFLAFLRQYAPSWPVQMPALLSPADREALQQTAGGARRYGCCGS